MAQMLCGMCKKRFAYKRSTAKFCSAKCRVYFNRSVTVSVTPKPVSVTDEFVVTELPKKWNPFTERFEYVEN